MIIIFTVCIAKIIIIIITRSILIAGIFLVVKIYYFRTILIFEITFLQILFALLVIKIIILFIIRRFNLFANLTSGYGCRILNIILI